jgi:hypothetical protein
MVTLNSMAMVFEIVALEMVALDSLYLMYPSVLVYVYILEYISLILSYSLDLKPPRACIGNQIE